MVRLLSGSDLEAVADRLAQVARRLTALREALLEIAEVRTADISSHADFNRIYALDSAFPPAPLELLGMSISMISHGWVLVERGGLKSKHVDLKVLVSYSGLTQDFVHATARRLEREDALKILEHDKDADLVVFDGEVVPVHALRRASKRWRDVRSLSYGLLRLALERGCVVVGVIKRVRSSSIARRLGLRVSDKALLTMLLRRGEYLVFEHEVEDLRGLGCYVIYYKPWRGVGQAVKVEACLSRSELLDPLVAFLVKEAGPTALPWFSDAVDGLVRAELRKLDALVSLLQKRLAEATEPLLAGPADLQKHQRRS